MGGASVVFHTASPFKLTVKDPQKELIDPALAGTRNVLEQATRVDSVQRVVVTSSVAAIYTDAAECAEAPNGILTEDVWNTTASLDTPGARGRHIIAGHTSNMLDEVQLLQPRFGKDHPIPTRAIPKRLVWLLAPAVGLTRRSVAGNVDVPFKLDNSKSLQELGLTYRPLKESMEDMFQYMIEEGYFQAAPAARA